MSKRKFSGSVNGKGYYIALILCAVAIGISGYLYYANQSAKDASADSQAELVGATDGVGTVATGPSQTQEPTGTQQAPDTRPAKRTAPVSGETVSGYAMDALSYNQTTRDWRTHNGIDIAAEAGTPVCAAAEGSVYAVYEDETLGTTVVIHHEGGYTTSYSSLDQEVTVKAGDQVSAGQTIGAVGNTALLENAIGDHLHFAVSCGNEPVDPESFLGD